MPEPVFSVVMPALNEEENIRAAITNTLAAYDDFAIDGEIVVINDGSTDRTPDIVAELMAADPRVQVVHHATPQGLGAAFWDGVGHARGKFLCMLPGDNENDPWEILQYHSLLELVDIVIPFVFNKEMRPFFRRLLSSVYRTIVNLTFRTHFNYTNGTVIYRKGLLDEVGFHSTGFFFQTDLLIRSVKRGYLFAEVPYRLGIRAQGLSKAVSYPSFKHVVKGYLRLVRDIYFAADRHARAAQPWAEGSQTERRRGQAAANESAAHVRHDTTPGAQQ